MCKVITWLPHHRQRICPEQGLTPVLFVCAVGPSKAGAYTQEVATASSSVHVSLASPLATADTSAWLHCSAVAHHCYPEGLTVVACCSHACTVAMAEQMFQSVCGLLCWKEYTYVLPDL